MPVRQDVQGDVKSQAITGYQATGAARAQPQGNADLDALGNANRQNSSFWSSLIQRGAAAGEALDNRKRAEAYLEGQQDNVLGKERSAVHESMQADYEQGYNRAQVGTDLAKFQLGIQKDAVDFVNAGKSPDDFAAHVKEQTDALLTSAGAQGMDLKAQDWQAWLGGVQSTRNTASDLYQSKSMERATYLRKASIAAEGSASIATFQAADEAGNPFQALDNMTAHIGRVYSDPTLSPQEKDGVFADFAAQAMGSARSSAAVEGVSTYFSKLPQFNALPTQVQTQIVAQAQRQYEQRAADESGAVFGYVSQVRAINDPDQLEREQPMTTFISNLNEAQNAHRISPSQMFGLVEEENTRRTKLRAAATKTNALLTGSTMSDIATTTGMTLGKTKTALEQTSAAANGGYSGGGLALIQRGLKSGAQDITSVGIEMLQQDAQSLGSIDSRNLKTDADGSPLYPTTVVSSLSNIKQAYDAAQRAGNNVQAAQLISGLPDAVAYGIRQASDANSVASVVYRRADDLAAGRVVALPASMPKEMLASTDDVTAGLFDTSLTQKGAARNILGVQSYLFTSAADKKVQEARLMQVNGAVSEEYTSLYQQGKLPALAGDDLKNWLVGRVSGRTVRVDDGTDNGSLMILPSVSNKAELFGSVDNNIIGQGLAPLIKEFKERNPGAQTVQLRYDNMSNELVVSATDKDNVLLTTSEGIPAGDVAQSVRAIEARLTSGGQGDGKGNLSVPGVGFMPFNNKNNFGIEQQTYNSAVTQLISYEGYTDQKGFSILAKHPTTGATLNEEKYVKQPEDTPQVATAKLGAYLNDKVLPSVMTEMPKFQSMPEYLRESVLKQLIETTYHAGNAQAFSGFLQKALHGDTVNAYKEFQASPLYKDAGAESRRNKDRLQLLQAVSQYGATQGIR
ncbi:putative internal virion protein B [Pseudomonas phage Ep4]|uniref:Internal virion protein B n=1 Tax=Pseudomonas phage Ep4 TaxID=3057492 RepID=A0AAU9EI06_9CAUD|nr:putative internal virion protein B [Pseudomonas phage Ep4]